MEDEITLSGALLRKFAVKVFDIGYSAGLRRAIKEIQENGKCAALTEKEYFALRTAELDKVEIV
jgi:hypothetical protein